MPENENGNATEHGENQNPASGNTEHGAENAGNTIPKARLDKEIEKRKAVEGELEGLVADLTEDVPEDYRGLIPDLPPAEKVKWLRNASRSGLFKPKQAEDGPGAQRPASKKHEDLDGMTPHQMMSMGYGKN